MSTFAVETARQEWEEGHRRFQERAQDPHRRLRLLDQLEKLTAELRRRLGTTFTLSELVETYPGVEDWAREAAEVFDRWPVDLTLVADEAFHLYSRGATDYRP